MEKCLGRRIESNILFLDSHLIAVMEMNFIANCSKPIKANLLTLLVEMLNYRDLIPVM